MFCIGASELVLIVIVALVVVGPRKLPDALRSIGRALGEFRRTTRDLRREVGYDEVVDEVTRPLRDGLASVHEEMRAVETDVRTGLSPSSYWADEKSIERANAAPAAAGDPYPPPDSAGLLSFDREYPAGGADDYGALPENANVYPERGAEGAARPAKSPAVEVAGVVSREAGEGGA